MFYLQNVALPLEVENNTKKTIDILLLKTKKNKKLSVNKSFNYDVFEHNLEFFNYLKPSFNYVIKFKSMDNK